MRHQKQKRPSFGRRGGPRKALLRGLIHSLVEQERIKTTLSKAKYARPFIEKALTLGKQNNLHSRRLLLARYPNKKTVGKIISVLSPRFKERPGGYTRIIKLGFRPGDQAPLAYLEFIDYKAKARQVVKQKTEAGEKGQTPSRKKNLSAKKSPKASKKRKNIRLQQQKSRRVNR